MLPNILNPAVEQIVCLSYKNAKTMRSANMLFCGLEICEVCRTCNALFVGAEM